MDGPVIQEAGLRALARGTTARTRDRRHRTSRSARARRRDDVLQPRLPRPDTSGWRGRWPPPAWVAPSRPTCRSRSWGHGRPRRTRPGSTRCSWSRRRARRSGSKRICARARGFVYAVARMGVTGERADLGCDAARVVERVREHTDMPVCVGDRRVDARTGGRGVRRCRRRHRRAPRWCAGCSRAGGPRRPPRSWARYATQSTRVRLRTRSAATAAMARCPAAVGCAARQT